MSGLKRWWIYQRERFPLARTSALVAAFAFSAVAFSGYLRSGAEFPSAASVTVAFLTLLGFFAQLRIADEHKDLADDSAYRPYRPVPRGLVTLAELRAIGLGIAAVQVLLALLLSAGLLILLVACWLYVGLMTKEFFVPAWLKARPLVYLVSHMLIMPLMAVYAAACEWMPNGGVVPTALGWLLVMSFLNGVVIEVARKVRAPQDEETGVETYTSLYGRRAAVLGLLLAMALAGVATTAAAIAVRVGMLVGMMLAVLFAVVAVVAARFLSRPTSATARPIEPLSGVWVLVAYLALAVVPLVVVG